MQAQAAIKVEEEELRAWAVDLMSAVHIGHNLKHQYSASIQKSNFKVHIVSHSIIGGNLWISTPRPY